MSNRKLFLIIACVTIMFFLMGTYDYVTGGTTDMTTSDIYKDPLISKYGGTEMLCGMMWEVPTDRTPWGHDFVVYRGMTNDYHFFVRWIDGVNYLYRWCN